MGDFAEHVVNPNPEGEVSLGGVWTSAPIPIPYSRQKEGASDPPMKKGGLAKIWKLTAGSVESIHEMTCIAEMEAV